MRSILAVWVALALAVLAITALFVWPGFLSAPAQCNPFIAGDETVNDRTYCVTPANVAPEQCANGTILPGQPTTWTSFWGHAFGLNWPGGWGCGLATGVGITVVYPNGTTYQGGIVLGGPSTPHYGLWFAPDNETGVDWRGEHPVAMVETGP